MSLNFRHVWIVLKKELKDAFRDRRALLVNIILPMLLSVVIVIVVSVSSKSPFEVKPEKTPICVIGKENSNQIVSMLEKSEFRIVDVDNPKKQLQYGKIKAVLIIPKDFENLLLQEKQTSIQILTNEADMKSSNVGSILSSMINEYSKQIVKQRLVAKNLDLSIIEPIVIKKENIAPPKKQSANLLVLIIPFFLTLYIAISGMNAAIDITAGEKERGTLEPLLTTAATRTSIVAGKYLAVSTLALLGGFSSIIGVIISFVVLPKVFGKELIDNLISQYSISLTATVVMLIVIILTAIIIGAIEVAIAAYARSFKEGQTYLSPITFVLIIPTYFTMYKLPQDLTDVFFIIPFVNTISMLKELIYDIINIQHLSLFILSSGICSVISIIFASKMFNDEKVLFRN